MRRFRPTRKRRQVPETCAGHTSIVSLNFVTCSGPREEDSNDLDGSQNDPNTFGLSSIIEVVLDGSFGLECTEENNLRSRVRDSMKEETRMRIARLYKKTSQVLLILRHRNGSF